MTRVVRPRGHDAPELELESTACGLCGALDEEELFRRGDLALGLPGEYRAVRCRQCGLRYLNPRPAPADIHHFYPPSYRSLFYPSGAKRPGEAVWRPWTWDRDLYKRCRAVLRRRERGRILDVGCGDGRFLCRLRDWGAFEVEGIELMPSAVEQARRLYGLELHEGTLLDVELTPGSFDVVTMWDSLEHLHHPLASLQRAAACLKPRGLLVLSTPTASSIDARIFGRYWIGYELPRHLTFFSNRTLEKMLGRAGFRVVDERVLHGGDFAFADEVRFALRGWGAPRAVHDGAGRVLKSRPWRWLTKPLFGLLGMARLTTPRTYFCVKED